jgi:hypothetical protein
MVVWLGHSSLGQLIVKVPQKWLRGYWHMFTTNRAIEYYMFHFFLDAGRTEKEILKHIIDLIIQ